MSRYSAGANPQSQSRRRRKCGYERHEAAADPHSRRTLIQALVHARRRNHQRYDCKGKRGLVLVAPSQASATNVPAEQLNNMLRA